MCDSIIIFHYAIHHRKWYVLLSEYGRCNGFHSQMWCVGILGYWMEGRKFFWWLHWWVVSYTGGCYCIDEYGCQLLQRITCIQLYGRDMVRCDGTTKNCGDVLRSCDVEFTGSWDWHGNLGCELYQNISHLFDVYTLYPHTVA